MTLATGLLKTYSVEMWRDLGFCGVIAYFLGLLVVFATLLVGFCLFINRLMQLRSASSCLLYQQLLKKVAMVIVWNTANGVSPRHV